MYPRLLELPWTAPYIGEITIYTYGVLLAAAYLLGLKLAMNRANARGLDGAKVLDLGIYIIISALIGAKLLLLITEFRTFRADPGELLTLARSGGVFYGGLILAVTVALWYIRRAGLPLWTTCDVFAPGIALGHVVGRFGCLFAGCCYGKPTTEPWGITFPRYEALMLLYYSRTGSLPLGKMGDRLQLHRTSLTSLMDGLEGLGLAQREPHPHDRRTTLGTITPEGRRTWSARRPGYIRSSGAAHKDLAVRYKATFRTAGRSGGSQSRSGSSRLRSARSARACR